MCGILVAFAKKGTLDENSCSRASKKIFSRGPDFNFSRFKLNGKLFLSLYPTEIFFDKRLHMCQMNGSLEGYL